MAESDIMALQNDPNSPINQKDDDSSKLATHCLLCDEYYDNTTWKRLEAHELDQYKIEKGFCSNECEKIYKIIHN